MLPWSDEPVRHETVSAPTPEQIDAGAAALRQHEQGGRILRPWESLPNCDKKKWQKKAQIVLRAAALAKNTG